MSYLQAKTTMRQKTIYIFLISIFISSCGMKSKKDLTKNYDEKSAEINELVAYFNKIVSKNYLVRIRYDSSDNVDLFVYERIANSEESKLIFQQWNVDLRNYVEPPQTEYDKKYNGETNSLEIVKQKLNWTNEIFIKLYEKLENVNCIGICNNNPTDGEKSSVFSPSSPGYAWRR